MAFLSTKRMSTKKRKETLAMITEKPKLDTPSTSWFQADLKYLMQKCWDDDPSERPTFEVVRNTLQDIIGDSDQHTPSPSSKATKKKSNKNAPKVSTVWSSNASVASRASSTSSQQRTASIRLSAVSNNMVLGKSPSGG
jgi:hypothetical protein